MHCPRCQHDNREGRRFCARCGAGLAAACPQCGFVNEPGDEFCGGCGARLGAPRPPRDAPASPEAYTPRHLAEKILTSRAALEGERKQVTVLFADLKGSMELLADRDPEEARRILDPVLALMMEAVHRYEGTVNQVMGDGIMALFGAPLAHEDHAVRACYAALRMQQAIGRHADELRRERGVDVQVRIGLNSGEVVVRSVGSDLRMDYTAVGQTTHLAARMEQLARPGTTLVTRDTLELAEGYVQVSALGPMPVKGLDRPVEVYELAGGSPGRTRLQALAGRGLSRFVGRDPETEELRRALERAAAGHGQVVAVVGEPGVGKSRLFWEFVHSHRLAGWLVVESASVSYGKATLYLSLISLVRAWAGAGDQDDARALREKVSGKLVALDQTLLPALPALVSLLGVPVDDAAWLALDPPQRRQRTLEACKRLFLRESQDRPLCLVVEDLHWVDAESQAFLDGLVEGLPAARVLLLVNYRPEYRHGWGQRTHYRQLQVAPLAQEGAAELLDALLGTDPGLAPLKALLFERTEGNPFFLEESVRSLVETQALAGGPGAYRLARPLASLQVPASVQAILAARIDRLDPEDKALLQTAAVVGKDVPYELLRAVADGTDQALRAGLGRLQEAEFLYEKSLFPDVEYTFKHALTHEVAYAGVLHERRRLIHGRVVDAMERVHEGRVPEHVDALAAHALRAERWEAAVGYLRQAGDRAVDRSANDQAVALYQQALDAAGHLPRNDATLATTADLHMLARAPLWLQNKMEAARDHMFWAEDLARALRDESRTGAAVAGLLNFYWITGRPAETRRYVDAVKQINERITDPALRANSAVQLSQVLHSWGAFEEARRTAEWGLRAVTDHLERHRSGTAGFPGVLLRAIICIVSARLGEFARAVETGQQALRLAERFGHAFTLVYIRGYLCYHHLERGELAEALAVSEAGCALARERSLTGPLTALLASAGRAHVLLGRAAEGRALLEEARRIAEASPSWTQRCRTGVYLGTAYVHGGEIEEGRRCLETALSLSRSLGERGSEAEALAALAEAHADSRGGTHDALARYAEARALATELRMPPLVARCHLGLGRLHRMTGQREPAREHLVTAVTMLREMAMPFWLAQAESELAALG